MSRIEGIAGKFDSLEVVKRLSSFIEGSKKGDSVVIKGLFGSSKAFLLSSAVKNSGRGGIHIVVEDTKEAAEYMCADLYETFAGEVYYFPLSSSSQARKISIKDSSNKVQRSITLSALNNFSSDDTISLAIVTYPDAVKEKIMARRAVLESILKISVGEEIEFDSIKEKLTAGGFERVDFVSEPGEFAIRGGIVDIFSYSDNVPYRIDFFGNSVESIRKFSLDTQRSKEEVKSVEIFPNVCGEDKVMAYGGDTLFNYASNSSVIIWNNTYEQLGEMYGDHPCISLNGRSIGEKESAEVLEMNCSPQPSFNRNFELLADDIRARKKQGYEVFISSSSKEQIERIRNIFKDSSHISEGEHPTFIALESSINEGFISSDVKICLYTDHQIFERYHRVKVRREVERSERLTLEDLSAFHVGDYVVHIDHGVGVFGGLVKTEVNGKHQEAIKIIYKDGDVIFVSVGGLHKISKYKSKDGEPPKIYKLGSGAWNKLKTTTKAKIKDIAKELIELYAKRKGTKGFAFSADSYLQNELEASFIFDDTPDQVKATKAVKADMESENPMDRLICGDVGFGKTEVAIRAAFKAVCDGKQVCVLVPTTILALQHYKTFTERLSEFPCKIDYISRLRTAKDIRQITEDVKEGKTDIIIGTHRLLNKNITFKDLGLLIIDEEQKFGVAAKERLRQLKVEVDTLTLTATPIPRTLQFSLLGARDLSIINTPPPNRLPVETEVIDFNEDYIKEAIESEIKRGGQVFFVHNRVEDILAVEQMINRICPMAKTIVGHGKMEPSLLENRILDFIRGDYDVLISTTIIENGIDIPNANTMIINQAQMFGLSDLHQLRGRVGRSNRRAYCYLIVPPMSSITEDAKRRIKAIEAFSELGSGFNIAMQDLDIRGAGNMLGGEQSGFIADMGFETYQKILNEAFIEINSQRPDFVNPMHNTTQFVSDCTVETDLEIFIPDEYIPQPTEKIKLYKDLDAVKDESDIEPFIESLKDRFGTPPAQVLELANVVKLRLRAVNIGVERIILKSDIMRLYFVSDANSAFYRTELYQKVMGRIASLRGAKLNYKPQEKKLTLTVPGVRSVTAAYGIICSLGA